MIFLIAKGNMALVWFVRLTFVYMFSRDSIAFPTFLVARVLRCLCPPFGKPIVHCCRCLGQPTDSESRLDGLLQSRDGLYGPQEHGTRFAGGSLGAEPRGEETGVEALRRDREKRRYLETKAVLLGDDWDECGEVVGDRSRMGRVVVVALASSWGRER
jgi:hypothetical protein